MTPSMRRDRAAGAIVLPVRVYYEDTDAAASSITPTI